MDIDEKMLQQSRNILGALGEMTRLFADIEEAMARGDNERARILLRRMQFALEATRHAAGRQTHDRRDGGDIPRPRYPAR